MEHQFQFNKKFYQDKKTCYWISTTSPRIRAHIWVWKYYKGEIPKGFHIHHIDEDKSNNEISNLKIMSKHEHLSMHMSTAERKELSSIQVNKIRHLTKEWHASEQGREWHRIHAQNTNFGKWDALKYTCMQCHKSYESSKRSNVKFCSNNCKSLFRRKLGIDDIDKTCPICKKIYRVNKYSKGKTCGRKCGTLFKSKVY